MTRWATRCCSLALPAHRSTWRGLRARTRSTVAAQRPPHIVAAERQSVLDVCPRDGQAWLTPTFLCAYTSCDSPHGARTSSSKELKPAPSQGSGHGTPKSRYPHTPQIGAQRNLQQAYVNGGGAGSGQTPKKIQQDSPPEEDEVGHYQVVIGILRMFTACGRYLARTCSQKCAAGGLLMTCACQSEKTEFR